MSTIRSGIAGEDELEPSMKDIDELVAALVGLTNRLAQIDGRRWCRVVDALQFGSPGTNGEQAHTAGALRVG